MSPRQAFGNDCAELKRSEQDPACHQGRVLAFDQYDLGRRPDEAAPFSAGLFPKAKPGQRFPEINTVRAMRPISRSTAHHQLHRLSKGKVIAAELAGEGGVKLVNNRGTQGKNDDLEVRIPAGRLFYEDARNSIWTDDSVQPPRYPDAAAADADDRLLSAWRCCWRRRSAPIAIAARRRRPRRRPRQEGRQEIRVRRRQRRREDHAVPRQRRHAPVRRCPLRLHRLRTAGFQVVPPKAALGSARKGPRPREDERPLRLRHEARDGPLRRAAEQGGLARPRRPHASREGPAPARRRGEDRPASLRPPRPEVSPQDDPSRPTPEPHRGKRRPSTTRPR